MNRWQDVEVGEQATQLRDGPLTVTDFVRYQGASGDMNPIHHDTGFAVAAGFPSPFAVGMRQAGVLGTQLAQTWGVDSVRRLSLRFNSQAWPGDYLTYSSTVSAKRVCEGEHLVDLDLAVRRDDGSLHISGSATVVVAL